MYTIVNTTVYVVDVVVDMNKTAAMKERLCMIYIYRRGLMKRFCTASMYVAMG